MKVAHFQLHMLSCPGTHSCRTQTCIRQLVCERHVLSTRENWKTADYHGILTFKNHILSWKDKPKKDTQRLSFSLNVTSDK